MSSLNNVSGSIPAGLIVDANALLAQAGTSTEFLKASGTAQATPEGVQACSSETSDAQQKLQTFWINQMEEIQNMSVNEFKTQELPLARIKKIMKMDDDVKMISAEAPLLFSKAAQIFITELSLRAWIHTEDSKRRTLQRNDIATAITKFDQFDFLIDIVPREELKPTKRSFGPGSEGVQFYYTLPQQTGTTTTVNSSVASVTQGPAPVPALQSGQLLLAQQNQNGQPMTLTPVNMENSQVLQLAQPAQQPQANQQQQQQQQQQTASTILLNTQTSDSNSQNINKQDPTVLQSSDQKNQAAQAILQQLVSNLPNAAPGEVHSIQINSQGQLQLVKVANQQPQSQASGNGQVFELAAGIPGSSRQVERDLTSTTSDIDSIYGGQDN